MSRRTSFLFFSALLFVGLFVFVSADQKNITAATGQNVTLTCRAPNNNISAVEWSRDDLGDEYVLFYRDKQFNPNGQHPSFKNRVDLQDKQMKDGDVSLNLNSVTTNDTGTYKCGVIQEEIEGLKHINNTYLRVVVPPAQTGGDTEDGPVGLKVGLVVSAVLLVAFVVVVLVCFMKPKCKNRKSLSQSSDQPLFEQ